jgi:hypothetical protein
VRVAWFRLEDLGALIRAHRTDDTQPSRQAPSLAGEEDDGFRLRQRIGWEDGPRSLVLLSLCVTGRYVDGPQKKNRTRPLTGEATSRRPDRTVLIGCRTSRSRPRAGGA